METVDLHRFELIVLLGSGADYEVRLAQDRETGGQVVVKRPVPQMISRRMHGAVEERTERTIRLHQELANSIPEVCPMIGYTDQSSHDAFYGDGLEQEYRVTVSERAPGIPLVGDPRARILRIPIGLGQNLFCLYPLCFAEGDDPFPIQRQLLDAEESFSRGGYVLLDMGPQNVFFQPGSGKISIIDPGALLSGETDRTPVGRGPQDIHDFYLEILKFYTTIQTPPTDVLGYRDPANLRPVVNFEQELNEMAQTLSSYPQAGDAAKAAGQKVIETVLGRGYREFSEFRSDLTDYLNSILDRNMNLANLSEIQTAWGEALKLLHEEHWTKYDFDAQSDLRNL